VPESFVQSTIVPLVKSKGGDLTDASNYRAIALSNACTKILESVMINTIICQHDADKYQFGIKKGKSTSQCTRALKNVVDYYTARGSHVFTRFVDFTKAFDRVNYWKLFNKLLDDNVPYNVVALLSFWYSHQQVNVRWHNVLSGIFCINNGTRQWGILSPYLFTRYISEAILAVVNMYTRIGCNIGGTMVNILVHADDLVVTAPSWTDLQELLTTLELNITDINVQCNIDKTGAWSSTQHVDLGLSGHTFQTYCLIINLCSLYLSFDILVISLTKSLKMMRIANERFVTYL